MGIPTTEQWLTGGKCKDCRRRTYCQKPCTANKNAIMALVRENRLKEEKGDGRH